jgi:hypothetical protein
MSTGNVILVMGLSSPETGGYLACFRRGLGTDLYRLGVSPKMIQETLRCADVSTTETHNIVVDRSETKVAMQKLEKAAGKEWARQRRTVRR